MENYENYENSPINRLSILMMNQRKDIEKVGHYDKMYFKELKRFDLLLNGDIFGDDCVPWNGESKKIPTCTFRTVKVSVRRLLYHNFVKSIENIKPFKNKCKLLKCCTISHI